jgi:hypothetical protein
MVAPPGIPVADKLRGGTLAQEILGFCHLRIPLFKLLGREEVHDLDTQDAAHVSDFLEQVFALNVRVLLAELLQFCLPIGKSGSQLLLLGIGEVQRLSESLQFGYYGVLFLWTHLAIPPAASKKTAATR